jgi:hypothetical protein
MRLIIVVLLMLGAGMDEVRARANTGAALSGQVDSVFITTKEGAILRTKGGVEVAPVEPGVRLLAIDYDPTAWGGRWVVSYNGQPHYLRNSDVLASDADRKLVQQLYYRGKTGESAAIRNRHFGLKGKRRWVSANMANVREMPDPAANVLLKLAHNEDVYLDEEAGGWSRIAYKGPFSELQPEKRYRTVAEYERACSFGWVHSSLLSNRPPKLRAAGDAAAAAKARREAFVAGSGDLRPEFRNAILAGRIVRGMSSEMVRVSLGEPSSVNRSVGSWGVNEQWIYGNLYAYLDNGVLTSWQEFSAR